MLASLLLALSSCTPALFDGMRRQGVAEVERSGLFPLFDGCDTSLFWDAKIKYKERVFTGVLALSPAGSNVFRLVFTSHFGPTVLDFEVGDRSFVLHHCLEELDRKTILSIFEQDFRTLLMLDVPQRFEAKVYSAAGKRGYNLNSAAGGHRYLTDAERRCLAVENPGLIKALLIRLEYNGFDLQKIVMKHPKLGLSMEMEVMKDE